MTRLSPMARRPATDDTADTPTAEDLEDRRREARDAARAAVTRDRPAGAGLASVKHGDTNPS